MTSPEWQEVSALALGEVFRSRLPQSFQKELVRKYGTRIPVQVLAHRFTVREKDRYVLALLVTDITKQQETERALWESEERYRSLVDLSPDGIIKDGDFRYVIANKQHEKLFDVKVEDIVGKTDFDFMPLEVARVCRESDIAALESEGPVSPEEYGW